MTQTEIVEMAIQGHASTRDAIRWAMNHEREACAKLVDAYRPPLKQNYSKIIARVIRARGQA